MSVQDPNNPHPVHSLEWVRANRRYEDELSRRTGPHPACFPAGTPVLTPRGSPAIEQLRVGDEVLAMGRDGALRTRRVHRVPPPSRAPLLTLHWAGRDAPLAATAHHAFSTDRGWVRARALRAGDRVQRVNASGRRAWAPVARAEVGDRPVDVFNLIVAGDLTFVAGGCLVHSFGYARGPRTAWHHAQLALHYLVRVAGGLSLDRPSSLSRIALPSAPSPKNRIQL